MSPTITSTYFGYRDHLFPDGSTGTTIVLGTSDAINDAVTVNGYYTLRFNDGSELWLKYTGTGAANKVKGTATVIGGKGRYAEAKGDGTFEGARQPALARAAKRRHQLCG
jgi:hypothetical protein